MGVSGQDRLAQVAVRLPELLDAELRKELRDGFAEPIKAFKSNVDTAIKANMPSGYRPVFAGAFRIVQTGRDLSITLRGTARGKAALRDSKALDEGRLKHPVFGRRRHGKVRPWVTQRIPPGFWTTPAKRLGVDITHAARKVAEKAAERVEKQL